MPYQSVFRPDLFKGQTIIRYRWRQRDRALHRSRTRRLGANVAILGRTVEKLTAVQREIEDDGGQVMSHACDIRGRSDGGCRDRGGACEIRTYRWPDQQCRRSVSLSAEDYLHQGVRSGRTQQPHRRLHLHARGL